MPIPPVLPREIAQLAINGNENQTTSCCLLNIFFRKWTLTCHFNTVVLWKFVLLNLSLNFLRAHLCSASLWSSIIKLQLLHFQILKNLNEIKYKIVKSRVSLIPFLFKLKNSGIYCQERPYFKIPRLSAAVNSRMFSSVRFNSNQ